MRCDAIIHELSWGEICIRDAEQHRRAAEHASDNLDRCTIGACGQSRLVSISIKMLCRVAYHYIHLNHGSKEMAKGVRASALSRSRAMLRELVRAVNAALLSMTSHYTEGR